MVKVLLSNADNARSLVKAIVPDVGRERTLCPCGCDRALENAVITAEPNRDPELLAKLSAVAGRVL